jgi:hypothetical protein
MQKTDVTKMLIICSLEPGNIKIIPKTEKWTLVVIT